MSSSLASWLERIEAFHPRNIELGLEPTRDMLKRLALPLPFCIAVGGSNGKGSCTRLLAELFKAAGYRAGAYYSPHIRYFNEFNDATALVGLLLSLFYRQS